MCFSFFLLNQIRCLIMFLFSNKNHHLLYPDTCSVVDDHHLGAESNDGFNGCLTYVDPIWKSNCEYLSLV